MAQYNVIGYDNQIIGEVDAIDAVEAWSKAGKQFYNILDVRQIEKPEPLKWIPKPFMWYHPETSRWLSVSGRRWESEEELDVAAIRLIPEMLNDLREELEPREYSGIIESGNAVVMVGDVDGYHYIKAFPGVEPFDLDMAYTETKKIMDLFSNIYEMEEAGYFEINGYLALSRGGA